jgi:hypothetical protein
VTGQWFSSGTSVSSTNKTEILLKLALNTIKQHNKDVILKFFSRDLTFSYICFFRIFNEFVQKTPIIEEKKYVRELQVSLSQKPLNKCRGLLYVQ